MMNASSLLIDIGGTDIKFALSLGTNLISESIVRVPFPQFLDANEKTISASQYLKLVKTSITSYLEHHNKPDQILISGQVGSWILTTPEGKNLTEIVSWQCTNKSETDLLTEIYQSNYSDAFSPLSETGNENWDGAPWKVLPKYLSELSETATQIYFHSLISWTVWELTSKNLFIIHKTDAAATGMYSIIREKWLGNFEGMSKDIRFPNVLKSIQYAGNFEDTDIKVYVGIGDQQASLLGVGITSDAFVINAGTGGQVARLLPSYQESNYKIRPYFDGQYIETITHIPSGRYISSFLQFLTQTKGDVFQWEWVWEQGFVKAEDKKEIEIENWNFDKYLEKIDTTTDSIILINNFLDLICQNFIEKLETLGCRENDVIILAGGVATKLKRLRFSLLQQNYRYSDTGSLETTLQGLAKLSDKLD
ncbi:XylB Sugar (pentulose and hexulose) kinases [Candidatus Nanopelagicaceae bacterium]